MRADKKRRGGTVYIPSNIYNFSDYRDFLKDRYRQLKEADPVFSFRFFSKQAGFGSPNYLKLVMDGKRNLSSDAIPKFAKGLRLDPHESEFFKYMVQYSQCENIQKKKVYEAKLMYLKELFKVKSLIPELYDYYHDWYHPAIREIIKNSKIKNDPAAIGAKLVPAISEEEAKASIELLRKLNFIRITDDNMLEACEETQIDQKSSEMAQKIHYEQMAELASQSLYIQKPENQEFGSVTLNLTPEKVVELKEKLYSVIKEFSSISKNCNGNTIYQLNIQLFALARVEISKEDEATT